MGFYVVLKLSCTLVIHCFRLVVEPTVVEDPFDVLAEMFSVLVLVIGQLFLDSLDVSRVFDN